MWYTKSIRWTDIPIPFLLFGEQILPTSLDVGILHLAYRHARREGVGNDPGALDKAEVTHMVQERSHIRKSDVS
jgi:hypothetical protein